MEGRRFLIFFATGSAVITIISLLYLNKPYYQMKMSDNEIWKPLVQENARNATRFKLPHTSKQSTGRSMNSDQELINSDQELINSNQSNINSDHSNETAPKEGSSREKTGYILALNSSDQSTGGAVNLMGLQCLAAQLDPRNVVVEPFIVKGVWGAHLSSEQEELVRENNVRLSDIYDKRKWDSVASSSGYAPLVKWEDFLVHAPRDLIFVDFGWHRAKCFLPELQSNVSVFSSLYNFNIVKTVCFHAEKSGALTFDQFKQQLYGNFTPSSVSVIMSIFGGINFSPDQRANRCIIKFSQCSRNKMFALRNKITEPSHRLLSDAQRYINEYLDNQTGYLSFMVRIEFISVDHDKNEAAVKACVTDLMKVFQKLQNTIKTKGVFLTMDVGKFGSIEVINGKKGNVTFLDALMRGFFHTLYGQTLAFSDWENSFQKISGLTSGGFGPYVAGLQKVVASRGRCIILAGGGSFQGSALNLYKENRKENLCFITINANCDQTKMVIPK